MPGRARIAAMVVAGLAVAAFALALQAEPRLSAPHPAARPGSIEAVGEPSEAPAARITDGDRTDGAASARSPRDGPGLLLLATTSTLAVGALRRRAVGAGASSAPKALQWFSRHSGRAPPFRPSPT